MKLGIMQPYFLPYIGYWQLIKAVDKYVVYDDVNYIKGGWVSRNNILMNGEKHLFTIKLNGANPNKLFNEIDVRDDFKKFGHMLQCCYSKAPLYDDTMNLIHSIIGYPNRRLSDFIFNTICLITNYLNIDTELLLSSDLDKDRSLKGKDKVMSICKNLGAETYVNAIGGQKLYDKAEFSRNGIDLQFLKSELTIYKQFKNEFIPGLSILDVLMFNSPEQINEMLDNYTLI